MTKSRIISAYFFVGVGFFILFVRYGYLQLINHVEFLKQSINNYSSVVSAYSVRGPILDKSGIILADNRVSYAVALLPKDLEGDSSELFESVVKYINLTELDKKKYKAQYRNAKNYDWVIIKDDLSDTEIANLIAHNYEFPQLSVFAYTKRYYPFGEIYSHSIGHVGKISHLDKAKLMRQNYLENDYVGKSGLEQFYESQLRGVLGKKIVKIDAYGNEVDLIINKPAINGYALTTTIDHNLQKLAWNLLKDYKGAIVAIDPKTGGVLAFVSKPGYDPNWFIDGISFDDWDKLSADQNKPLLNRALQGTYPPGSTFKPFLALAALYWGCVTPSSTIYDPGYYVLPKSRHKFRDSYQSGRGTIDLMQAIYYSSDTYFYKLGLELGIDRANKILSLFGFGKRTGIDLLGENNGLLPSKEWKAKHFANSSQKKWLATDSINFGVGQGFNHYTPLQMAFATATLANMGKVIPPHFFNYLSDKNGTIIESYIPHSTQLNIPKSQFDFIKLAMQNVVVKGTANGISTGLKYTMAGKTGTAQVIGMNQNNRQAKSLRSGFKDHSWFIAFAPVEDPKIAIAVIVENGGWGAKIATPIARHLFDAYILGSQSVDNTNSQYKKFINIKSQNAEMDEEDDESFL